MASTYLLYAAAAAAAHDAREAAVVEMKRDCGREAARKSEMSTGAAGE